MVWLSFSEELLARKIPHGSFTPTTTSFTTSFPATENPISQGGIWTRGLAEGLSWTNPATGLASDSTTHVAYGARVSSNAFDDAIAHLSLYSADHWCQGTIYNDGSVTGLPEVELLIRWAITANNARGYEVDILSDGRCIPVRWNGALSNFTLGSTFTTNASMLNNAVWRAQIVGNILSCTCNGNPVFSIDITSHFGAGAVWSSGNPGMGYYGNNGTPDPNTQANRHFALKAYSAGNL